jgi:NAD(P)H-dependent FMN reductase
MRPVTVQLVVVDTHVLPSEAVTTKPVMALPSSYGGVQETVADPSPAVAVTFVGANGAKTELPEVRATVRREAEGGTATKVARSAVGTVTPESE